MDTKSMMVDGGGAIDAAFEVVRGAAGRPMGETRAALIGLVAGLASADAAEVARVVGDLRYCGARGAVAVAKEVEAAVKAARGRAAVVKVDPAVAGMLEAALEDGAPWGDAPKALPEGWRDPAGWRLLSTGVWRERKGSGSEEATWARVTHRPIWISARWADVDAGDVAVEVSWQTDSGAVVREVVSRSVVVSARDVVALAGRGAPVSSRSARDVVAWLEVSEDRARDVVPLLSSLSRLGWTTAGESQSRLMQLARGPHMLRSEGGHAQTARALVPAGTWEEWLSAAKVVQRHPVMAVMLAASVASALLEPAGAAPFVVDLHGQSSRGKTTALRWAASAWADPSDGGAYLLPWSATLAAIEGRAGFLTHLPLLLDDTKKIPAKDRDILAKVVYQWGSGQGKARGAVGGVREVETWRSVLLSTGEASLTQLAGEHVGLRLRVLSISAQPIPDGDVEAVMAVEALDAWGHLGPRVAEWAAARWEALPSRWRTLREAAQGRLAAGPSAGRVAGYLASVGLGLEALAALGVPLPDRAAMWAVLQSAATTALTSSDTAGAAWGHLGAWLASVSERLTDAPGQIGSPAQPAAGWIGRYTEDGVALVPTVLSAEIRRWGYDPEEIIPQWRTQGRISSRGDKTTTPTWWQGKSVRLVRLLNVFPDATEDEPQTPMF